MESHGGWFDPGLSIWQEAGGVEGVMNETTTKHASLNGENRENEHWIWIRGAEPATTNMTAIEEAIVFYHDGAVGSTKGNESVLAREPDCPKVAVPETETPVVNSKKTSPAVKVTCQEGRSKVIQIPKELLSFIRDKEGEDGEDTQRDACGTQRVTCSYRPGETVFGGTRRSGEEA